MRFLISTITSSPGILFFYTPLLIGTSTIGVAVPFATGRLIDALADHQSFHGPITILIALMLSKTLLSSILQRAICSRARAAETDLQFRILEVTMALSPGEISYAANGELMAKLTRDTYAIGEFIRGLYPRLLQAVVMMLVAGFALRSRSTALCISFMVFFPLTFILFAPFARHFATNSHHVRRQSDASFCALLDFLQVLPLLRTLDAERRFINAPHDALLTLKKGNDTTDALSVKFGFLLGILLIGGEATVLIVASSLAVNGTIPVGDVVLYQMLFIAAIQSIQNVIGLLPEFAAMREGANSIEETLKHIPPQRGHERFDDFKNLEFSHVTFAYPHATDHPVVKDFSASFTVGSVVGLSGANGSGKSTLLKLAVGALEPQKGMILINGRPLATINPATFRCRIGIVSQDNLIITGTIRDNITLRNPAFTQQDIETALALSGFDAVAKRFSTGLDTPIGNNIRMLSGGERQRLAIARAIIRNPAILILDEATNHLDAESRKSFAKLVARLRQGRLILLAEHDTGLDNLCDVKISCQI